MLEGNEICRVQLLFLYIKEDGFLGYWTGRDKSWLVSSVCEQ